MHCGRRNWHDSLLANVSLRATHHCSSFRLSICNKTVHDQISVWLPWQGASSICTNNIKPTFIKVQREFIEFWHLIHFNVEESGGLNYFFDFKCGLEEEINLYLHLNGIPGLSTLHSLYLILAKVDKEWRRFDWTRCLYLVLLQCICEIARVCKQLQSDGTKQAPVETASIPHKTFINFTRCNSANTCLLFYYWLKCILIAPHQLTATHSTFALCQPFMQLGCPLVCWLWSELQLRFHLVMGYNV